MAPVFTAFTTKPRKGGILRELINNVGVSLPYDPRSSATPPKISKIKALWDTGATNCVITKKTAEGIGLEPFKKVLVHHAKGSSIENVYKVNIYLPNNVAIADVNITECADAERFGFIIGMNVITLGDFSITNVGGTTVFSFRFPSIKEIDYVKEAEAIKSNSSMSPRQKRDQFLGRSRREKK